MYVNTQSSLCLSCHTAVFIHSVNIYRTTCLYEDFQSFIKLVIVHLKLKCCIAEASCGSLCFFSFYYQLSKIKFFSKSEFKLKLVE